MTPDTAGSPAAGPLTAWLVTPPGQEAIEQAVRATGSALAALAALREAGLSGEQAAAALTQAELRQLARQRYGIDASGLVLTRDGLEQATRPAVAQRRARLLHEAGVRRVVDLTGGLGFDARAFVSAGLEVTAVERDPDVAALLAHNCPQATVVCGDSAKMLRDSPTLLLGDLEPTDAVFADPARRDPSAPRDTTLRARPERDPERWSPPWSALERIDHPRVVVKAAPAFTPPEHWSTEWISVHRTLVECTTYSWPVFPGSRRAVIVPDRADGTRDGDATDVSDAVLVASADPWPEPASAAGAWLVDPDPSVARARATTALLARHPRMRPLGPQSSWLTAEQPLTDEPFARHYPVIAELTGSVTQQRRLLDDHGVTALTVRSADVGVTPASVLRELRRREGNELLLVLTRVGGRTVRYLCGPAPRRSG